MRVLVVGGTGFIGQHIVTQLLDQELEVAVFHRGESKAKYREAVKYIHGDRHKFQTYLTEFKQFQPDVVVDVIPYTQKDAETIVNTFDGLVKRIVALSSGDVYRNFGGLNKQGDAPPDITPLTENSPLRETHYLYRKNAKDENDWLYHYEKVLVEHELLRTSQTPCTILRLPKVYGPYDQHKGFMPYAKRMADNRPFILLDEGLKDWKFSRGYVENVAAAVVLATLDKRTGHFVYNVSDDHVFSESELIQTIATIMNWDGEMYTLPKDKTPVHLHMDFDWRYHLDMDSTKIRNELGFRDRISQKEAMGKTIDWTTSVVHLEGSSPAYDYQIEDKVFEKSIKR